MDDRERGTGEPDPVDDDTPSGLELGERFRLGRQLGAGGMAVVHLAYDAELERDVAVKRLHPELADHAEIRQRFLDEARIMAALDHPGALPVFALGEAGEGGLYYAMKRVRGRTLAELLAARTREELYSRHSTLHHVDLFERVCQTVAAAHSHGIIHRDIKPENVLVDEHGSVFLVDWGLARRLADAEDDERRRLTRHGAVMGTPAYMSPEQASGASDRSDCQSDVFSLGVMLYEILTGTNPFADDDPRTSIQEVIHHDPVDPRKLNRHASRALAAVAMKALNKDPFRRYPTALELAADLRRYREFLPVTAIEPRAIDRLYNWARRKPVTAAVAATLALVAVAGSLGLAMTVSVERHMVEEAYDEMDRELGRLLALEGRLEEVEARLTSAHGRERDQLAAVELDLISEIESVRQLVTVRAASILGFTAFSPEQRAREVLRALTLDSVEDWIESGQHGRAAVTLRALLIGAEGRNLFELSPDERRRLEERLARVEAEMRSRREAIQGDPDSSSGP